MHCLYLSFVVNCMFLSYFEPGDWSMWFMWVILMVSLVEIYFKTTSEAGLHAYAYIVKRKYATMVNSLTVNIKNNMNAKY
jgi:hypothetical protein